MREPIFKKLPRIKTVFLFLTVFVLTSLTAISDEFRIIPRSEWGARSPRKDISKYQDYGYEVPKYTSIVIHSTSQSSYPGKLEPLKIQLYQMFKSGFSDIGYNYIIDKKGRIYAGRSLEYVPSHAGQSEEANENNDIFFDPDFGSIGIAFSSNDQALTDAQVNAAKWLVEYLMEEHPISKLITHADVKYELEDLGLTPIGEYDAHQCPGAMTVDQVIDIQSVTGLPFNEKRFREMFKALEEVENHLHEDHDHEDDE
jgi:hypothetical protein